MIPGDTVVVDGTMSLLAEIEGDFELIVPIDGEFGVITAVTEYDLPPYTGQTVITPSENVQTLMTADKVVTQNIIVNPVPENYGRLLWSGNTLTVY